MKYLIIFLLVIGGFVILQNSAYVYASDSLYQIPYANFDKHEYKWGEQGKLYLESSLANKVPQKIEVITPNTLDFGPKLYLLPNSIDLKNFVLTETGPDTGLFVWSFTVSDPNSNEEYDTKSSYIPVTTSTESITFEFDMDSNTSYSISARITSPENTTIPEVHRQRIKSMYPSIQFRNLEMTSPYDGNGMITVQHPSQNMSPSFADQLKVVFRAFNSDNIFDVLNETGTDTGVFEGKLSFSSYPSFSKLYLNQGDTNSSSISVNYLVSDTLSSTNSNSIILHHELEYNNTKNKIHNNSNLYVSAEKKAYLGTQSIMVYGFADPDEVIDVSISSTKSDYFLFNIAPADSNGQFETEFTWSEPLSHSVEYTIQAISKKNDNQATYNITIVSMEDLKSRSILIPPKQQFEMGLEPNQIVCKQVWKLILKPGGDVPACVKLPTYAKLLERGWNAIS